MIAQDAIQQANRQLARRINAEAQADPHSPYAGKFAGITAGRVVSIHLR